MNNDNTPTVAAVPAEPVAPIVAARYRNGTGRWTYTDTAIGSIEADGWNQVEYLCNVDAAAAQATPPAQSAPPAAPAPAPVLLTDALRTELVADAREVFSADVLGTPQDIRDVIEYVDSWLQVYIQKRAESGAPAPAPQPLTERERELIAGMIEVQLHHAAQCDSILATPCGHHNMAAKQKGWDMERVALLRKLGGITGGATGSSK